MENIIRVNFMSGLSWNLRLNFVWAHSETLKVGEVNGGQEHSQLEFRSAGKILDKDG